MANVTIRDILNAGICVSGTRMFFKHHGLNFGAFIRDGGIDSEILLATNDAQAKLAVAEAERREREDGC